MSFNIVMVGAGYFGRLQAGAWERIDGAELVGIADRSPSNRDDLKIQFPQVVIEADLSTLLSRGGVDVVDVATPPETHVDVIYPLLGKVPTIICQKPFCGNLERARWLVEKAQESGTKLIVHENFRFMPWYRKIRRVIDSGDLGVIRQAHFRLRPGDGNGLEAYLARQPYFRTMEQFLVHETGIHWIDVFRYLFGEVESVFADLWQSNTTIKGEDSGILILTLAGGVRATLDANRTLDHKAENRRLTMGEFIVEGSEASLYLDGDGKLTVRAFDSTNERTLSYEMVDQDFGGDCVFHFQTHVVEHLQGCVVLETRASDYLTNMQIEEAAYRSAGAGAKIML